MNRTRRSLILGGLAVLATALTGCFPLIKEDSAQQQQPMSDVDVRTTSCSTPLLAVIGLGGGAGSLDDLCVGAEDGAALYYEEDFEFNIPLPGQVLLAYRVPKGAEAPETLTTRAELVHFTDWFEFMDGGGRVDRGTGTGTSGERPDPPATREVDVTFTRAPQLDAHLPGHYARTNDDDPENDEDGIDILAGDQEIVSYVSGVVPGAMVGDWKVEAPFGLPAGSRPYSGPFNHVSMVGWRAAMTPELEPPVENVRALRAAGILRGAGPLGGTFGDLDPDRAFDCSFLGLPNESELRRALRGVDEEPDLTLCPMPQPRFGDDEEEPVISVGSFAGTHTTTRDLDLRGSGETFVEQGKTASVPYSLVGAGPAGGELDVTATISPAIPGVGPIKQEVDFPGTGTHGRAIEIKVPESAAARTYEVLVTASKGEHQRTAKAGLVVLPKAQAAAAQPSAPAGTRAASRPFVRPTVWMDKQGFIRFSSTCGSCAIDGLVPFGSLGTTAKAAQAGGKHRLLRVARGKVRGEAGARRAVKVKLFPKAQRSLRKGRRLTGVIVFRKGASGTPQVRKVVFRGRRK